jgi:hypothetical protein
MFLPARFDAHVIEEQVLHSTALHARLAGSGRYLTGPSGQVRAQLALRQPEQAIRNYDPCISCSSHFLGLTVDRS